MVQIIPASKLKHSKIQVNLERLLSNTADKEESSSSLFGLNLVFPQNALHKVKWDPSINCLIISLEYSFSSFPEQVGINFDSSPKYFKISSSLLSMAYLTIVWKIFWEVIFWDSENKPPGILL